MSVKKPGWHQGSDRLLPHLYKPYPRKRVEWRKHATHSVRAVDLPPPLAKVEFSINGAPVEKAIYLFDQEAAHQGIKYAIEDASGRRYSAVFHLLVESAKLDAAQKIVARLQPPPPSRSGCVPFARSRELGWWSNIHGDFGEWRFALYHEFASTRSDNQDYLAFLFRNSKRTEFGIQEFLGEYPTPWGLSSKFQKLAEQISTDVELRAQFLSDDPDLPKMWRRH